MADWYVYILKTRLNTLYTGIATDVKRRIAEHESGVKPGAKYLRSKGPLKLVFQYKAGSRALASKIEYRIKALSRSQKNELIEEVKAGQLLDFLQLASSDSDQVSDS